MSAHAILERAEHAGLVLALGSAGKLRCAGDTQTFARLRSELMAHKTAILAALGQRARAAVTKPTSPLFCTVCGPIHANEKPVAHGGYGYGMAIVTSCEWCRAGKSPSTRPKVACSTCKHFTQSVPSIAGPGDCAVCVVPAGMAQRSATLVCGAWVPNRVAGGKP